MSGAISPAAVIRRTCNVYLDQRRVWLPVAAGVFGITGLLDAIVIAAAPDFVYVSFLISDVATTLCTGMIVGLVTDARAHQRERNSGQLLLAVKPVLGNLVLVGIVAGVGVFFGFILIVVPGLLLTTVWSVAAPIVVMEQPGGLRALGRSRELVRGYGRQVFTVVFVMVFLVGLVTSGIDLAAASVGAGLAVAVRVIAGIVVTPLAAFAAAVLYFELHSASGTAGTRDSAG